MRRKDRETTREEAWKIFDACDYAVVSMILDENPYATALSVARIEETLYFHGAKEGDKIDALTKNPRICLHAVAHMQNIAEKLTVHYASCTIHGWAEEVTEEEEKRMALIRIAQRFAPGQEAMAQQEIDSLKQVTSVWKIHVDSISGKRNPLL